jgi:hypothetical protein
MIHCVPRDQRCVTSLWLPLIWDSFYVILSACDIVILRSHLFYRIPHLIVDVNNLCFSIFIDQYLIRRFMNNSIFTKPTFCPPHFCFCLVSNFFICLKQNVHLGTCVHMCSLIWGQFISLSNIWAFTFYLLYIIYFYFTVSFTFTLNY